MDKIAALALLCALSGCVSPQGSFCLTAQPQRPSSTTLAAMSDREVNDMLAHNELGAKLCGWKP